MKTLKLSLCFFIIFMFSACSEGEFRSLSSFISSYNETASKQISFEDFIITSDNSYTAFLYGNVLLSLRESTDGKIEECKVIIAKPDGTLPKDEDIAYFREVLNHTLMAYCSYDERTAKEISDALGLGDNDTFRKKGELTLTRENFYFVYYSDDVTSQLRVYNTYCKKIEETSKPVSRPYYGENFVENG